MNLRYAVLLLAPRKGPGNDREVRLICPDKCIWVVVCTDWLGHSSSVHWYSRTLRRVRRQVLHRRQARKGLCNAPKARNSQHPR